MTNLKELEKRLNEESNPEKAKLLSKFFKTGKGEYGEGDIFLGIMVPIQRKIIKEFCDLSLDQLQELLDSKIHEKRLIALLILVKKYERACKNNEEKTKREIFDFYLDNARKNNINNWDLVDLSAPRIVGNYLIDNNENSDNSQALALRGKASRNREILYQLARSDNLWERRISILATFMFIRQNDFKNSLEISEILLQDSHDLIHKAVGWMLREVGKKDVKVLEEFLKNHSKKMPRTMLRYAIEKFPENERKKWLRREK